MRLISMLACVCLLFSSLSCASLRQLMGIVAEKPQVKLERIDIQSLSMQRIELLFVLDIVNTNNFPIEIESLDYRVEGLGEKLGKGRHHELITLEAKEHSSVRLPFTLDPDAAVIIMKKYLKNPRELKLKLIANLQLKTGFGNLDMQFEEERSMLKGLPNP